MAKPERSESPGAAHSVPARVPLSTKMQATTVLDDTERDAARDLAGFKGTAHTAGYDEGCEVCKHPQRDAAETLYLRGDSPSEIARLMALSDWRCVDRHARGLNLDIQLSKDTDRVLALMISRGVHDLKENSVDAKVLLAAIHERNVLDGKVVQRVHMDRPSQIIFVGSSPEPGVVRGAVVHDMLPPVSLDVPSSEETIQVPTETDKDNG